MLAYLDCSSGVSDNMLLDAGYPEVSLCNTLAALPLDGAKVLIDRRSWQGVAATQVVVIAHHGYPHPHRHFSDIVSLLREVPLPELIRQGAVTVFTRLAETEAAVHGTSVEAIHFHEVAAVDTLINIVGVLAACVPLGIDRLHCSPLPCTRGWVNGAHGEIPLPGPAVCRLLDGVPVYGLESEQEQVTSTGAALVRELVDEFGPMPPMLLRHTGYGAGILQRNDGRPNMLRLMLGYVTKIAESQQMEVIETHCDDWNPECWPSLCGQLMEGGALDVGLIPMQMKKGCPGFPLRVSGELASRRPALTDLIFRETSSIGLRLRREAQVTLPRIITAVSPPWEELPAKGIIAPEGRFTVPGYEACRQVAWTASGMGYE